MNTGGVRVIERLCVLRERHNVHADLAVLRALGALDALIVRDDLELAELRAHHLVKRGEWAPVSAPDFAAKERVERDGNHRDQPEIHDIAVALPPDIAALRVVRADNDGQHQQGCQEDEEALEFPRA